MRRARLLLAGGAAAAALLPVAPASASTCSPVFAAVCWAWGTACQYVPHDDGRYDPHSLLCTVVM